MDQESWYTERLPLKKNRGERERENVTERGLN